MVMITVIRLRRRPVAVAAHSSRPHHGDREDRHGKRKQDCNEGARQPQGRPLLFVHLLCVMGAAVRQDVAPSRWRSRLRLSSAVTNRQLITRCARTGKAAAGGGISGGRVIAPV